MLLRALFVCVLTAGCEVATVPLDEAVLEFRDPVRLELTGSGALPVVTVDLDGRALPFLVDTGADLTLVDLDRARALGLSVGTYATPGELTGSSGATVPVDAYAIVRDCAVGSLRTEGVRIPALSDPVFGETGIVGILGQDLLARMTLVVDVAGGWVQLFPERDDPAGFEGLVRTAHLGVGEWRRVPVELSPTPVLDLVIAGLPDGALTIELDTGAVTTSLPGAAIDALGLEAVGTKTVVALGEVHETSTYHVEGLELFGFRVDCDLDRGVREGGLLGMNVLREFVFAVDGPASELWIHHRATAFDSTIQTTDD